MDDSDRTEKSNTEADTINEEPLHSPLPANENGEEEVETLPMEQRQSPLQTSPTTTTTPPKVESPESVVVETSEVGDANDCTTEDDEDCYTVLSDDKPGDISKHTTNMSEVTESGGSVGQAEVSPNRLKNETGADGSHKVTSIHSSHLESKSEQDVRLSDTMVSSTEPQDHFDRSTAEILKPGSPASSALTTTSSRQSPTENDNKQKARIPTPPDLGPIQQAQKEDKEVKTIPNLSLNIGWSFGFNKNIPVLNLTDDKRTLIIYTSSHTGILYDYVKNKQWILQGHANSINCTCLSRDKKWLVTADKGRNSCVIVWDTFSCVPVQTLFDASPDGMAAIALTPDSKYLATLSASSVQEFSLWDWTVSGEKPTISVALSPEYGLQNYIYFNPENFFYIVTNSESRVIFYQWEKDELKWFAPPLTDQDFNTQIGKYSQSIFQYQSTRALTATSVGNLVVWETKKSLTEGKKKPVANKKALKIIKLVGNGINVLNVVYNNIVIGDLAGNVSFFDQKLMLLHRYNNLEMGPVNFLSFSLQNKNVQYSEKYPRSCTLAGEPFISPDFILSSTTALCGLVKAEGPEIELIMRDHGSMVPAIGTHPFQPFLVTGSHSGFLKVWDYDQKIVVASRQFEKAMIQSCAYSPNGYHLAVGFTSGMVQVLDSLTLASNSADIHHYSRDAITHIIFSQNSEFIAIADAGYTTCLLKKRGSSFICQGRYRAHYQPIRDIMFGDKFDSKEPRLLSLGEDRMLVEYDLENSSTNDLKILSIERIEQSALPLCMAWYPLFNKEHFIVTVNNQYKYKLYNSSTKMCRKTVLGPTYGSPLDKILILPTKGPHPKHQYMAYITEDKVGLQILPFDGNPHRCSALIAHPDGVSNIVSSYDGQFLFTTSKENASIHMWNININALEAQSMIGGEHLIPFYELIEGGQEGPLFEELKEYFYFSQLRSSGINSMEPRPVSTTISITEIPYVMRALGFYPSEQELTDMVNEVKYSEYVDTGKFKEDINIGDFLKLYINHRPFFVPTIDKLKWAFQVLGSSKDEVDGGSLFTDELLELLQSKGEHITTGEMDEILTQLCMYDSEHYEQREGKMDDDSRFTSCINEKLPEVMTPTIFSSKLLGFQTSVLKK